MATADAARPKARVIVADDEESMRHFVRRGLARLGYDIDAVDSGEAALARFDMRGYDVAVVDLKMPGLDGLDVLQRLRERSPEAIVIIMTAFGTIGSAVAAMKLGAFHYVTKPFEIEELGLLLERALAHRATVRENRDLRRLVDTRTAYGGLIGQSPAMRAVFQQIDVLRGSNATVLITGESGTGKELVARAIHMGSARAQGPFVPLHCAVLADTLVENELFGHEPGAFTGAIKAKLGLLAKADGGTLFLDEISETSLPVQAKLERFLQEREFMPLGGSEPVAVDLRIIAASNKDLDKLCRDGAFRRELFFRLDVVPVHLAPLRERREDVPPLVAHFLERFVQSSGGVRKRLAVDAMVALSNHDWPGNVREVQNAVERLCVLHQDQAMLELSDLPPELRGQGGSGPSVVRPSGAYDDALSAFEREYTRNLLRRTKGNVSEAARIAGMSRGHLHRKIKRLDLDPGTFR